MGKTIGFFDLRADLTYDLKTSVDVGRRHGVPYVYKINATKMVDDRYKFYLSANGVWLTKYVPVQYWDSLLK